MSGVVMTNIMLTKTVKTKGDLPKRTTLPSVRKVEQGEVRYYINESVYVPESVLGRENVHSSDNARTTTRWDLS